MTRIRIKDDKPKDQEKPNHNLVGFQRLENLLDAVNNEKKIQG
jgi:hypothetical protein